MARRKPKFTPEQIAKSNRKLVEIFGAEKVREAQGKPKRLPIVPTTPENAKAKSKPPSDSKPEPDPPPKKKPIHITKLGTPCSPSWDDDWIEEVEATEAELGHRCCGAHAPDDEPCILKSTSKNGRCRFHGGGKNVGAPNGNTNARIHGLYMRRVQQCGSHCAMWKTCPMAGQDITETPERKRPLCTYEVDELTALREMDQSVQKIDEPGKPPMWDFVTKSRHPFRAQLTMLRENLHTLQIMIARATKAIHANGFTTETIQQTDTYYASHEKPSAMLQALQILTREHRQTLNTYYKIINAWGLHAHQPA